MKISEKKKNQSNYKNRETKKIEYLSKESTGGKTSFEEFEEQSIHATNLQQDLRKFRSLKIIILQYDNSFSTHNPLCIFFFWYSGGVLINLFSLENS